MDNIIHKLKEISLSRNLLNMDGISENQIRQHYQLYQGYVNKINQIWGELITADRQEANSPTYSYYRELKFEESYALNGVKLHELYFLNLGGKGTKIGNLTLEQIKRDFTSYDKWLEDFLAAGRSMRGWVMLAYEPIDGLIHNYGLDSHNLGMIESAIPLLVLDVYEHAYMIDYGINRKGYLNAFLDNVNWDVVERRLRDAMRGY
jgi:superoxide dismutase, Fe-Mn family